MESAIKTVVEVYLKSAKGKENLGAKDFQSLVKNQLKNILTDTDSSDAIKQMREGLDDNHDGKVNFQEYMKLIGYLASSLSQQQATDNAKQADSPAPETQAAVAAEAQAEPEAAKEAEKVEEPVAEAANEEKKVEEEEEKAPAEEKAAAEEGEKEVVEEKTEEAS